jgi:hypothetical protein
MTSDMGRSDRMIRALLIAPVLVVVGIVAGPTSVLDYVLYALAAVMLLTSAVGFCPHALLGCTLQGLRLSGRGAQPG